MLDMVIITIYTMIMMSNKITQMEDDMDKRELGSKTIEDSMSRLRLFLRRKTITVYAHRSDETRASCTVKFTRRAYYDVGRLENGRWKATVGRKGQGFATPITLIIKASPFCAEYYSMRDFCDLAQSCVEAKKAVA